MAWVSSWWSQVSGTATHGLQITVVGMSLVFLTLGLIILSLFLLTRLPGLRARERPDTKPTQALSEPPAATTTDTDRSASTDEELAQVAAITVAILRSHRRARVRSRTHSTRSAWKHYGRAQQLGL